MLWIGLVLAIAAYCSVIVRNVTDMLVGITHQPSVPAIQRPAR